MNCNHTRTVSALNVIIDDFAVHEPEQMIFRINRKRSVERLRDPFYAKSMTFGICTFCRIRRIETEGENIFFF